MSRVECGKDSGIRSILLYLFLYSFATQRDDWQLVIRLGIHSSETMRIHTRIGIWIVLAFIGNTLNSNRKLLENRLDRNRFVFDSIGIMIRSIQRKNNKHTSIQLEPILAHGDVCAMRNATCDCSVAHSIKITWIVNLLNDDWSVTWQTKQ